MDTVERIAEVVLYEGFLLYPYTRSTTKNQQRWTFGGVYPRHYSEASGGSDPWLMQTQCLVVGGEGTELEVKVRFLHVVDRRVVAFDREGRRDVAELRVGDTVYRPWEEAVEREIVLGDGHRSLLLRDAPEGRETAIEVEEGSSEERLQDGSGACPGALVRTWRALHGEIALRAEPQRDHVYRVTVRIANTTPWGKGNGAYSRGDVVRQALISTHTILRVRNGAFVSLLEPPAEYEELVNACENVKTWPVLVGEEGERHTLLSSPIILYDYPQIAPESHVSFFDTTEIDELLALSVMTLTDDEKREMRETDPKAREILERTESLSPQELMALHGSIRGLRTLRGDGP